MSSLNALSQTLVELALRALGKERLVLIAFDSSFPQQAAFDTGFGSPYSESAAAFLGFIGALGFGALQFGPQGRLSAGNASPYDGAAFSRNPLAIAFDELGAAGLSWLSDELVQETLASRPLDAETRVPFSFARRASEVLLEGAWVTLLSDKRLLAKHSKERARRARRTARELAEFRRCNADWLVPDALYAALSTLYGCDDFRLWGEHATGRLDALLYAPSATDEVRAERRRRWLERRYRKFIDSYVFAQYVAHKQHRSLLARCKRLGFGLYGDLQIGLSLADVWRHQAAFLRSYRMGAPPSRTTPLGQPWGYPVLDPKQYLDGASGPARRLLLSRASKQFAEYDMLRIDHPHGLVCPWVYRADVEDAFLAVRAGARLFSSPALADHPELHQYSFVDRHQIDERVERHADGRVQSLSAEQVARFATCLGLLVEESQDPRRLMCEVLSTLPNELEAVLKSFGLGRFRITQKADLSNPGDVYRSENANENDWIMVGNHDTPSIWQLVESWREDGRFDEQKHYLAQRLGTDELHRRELAQRFEQSPSELVHAKFADVFLSKAKNVMIFWPDLLGFAERYNVPGTVNESNWSLRIPRDYATLYAERVAQGRALSLPKILALALRKAGLSSDLAAKLEASAPLRV